MPGVRARYPLCDYVLCPRILSPNFALCPRILRRILRFVSRILRFRVFTAAPALCLAAALFFCSFLSAAAAPADLVVAGGGGGGGAGGNETNDRSGGGGGGAAGAVVDAGGNPVILGGGGQGAYYGTDASTAHGGDAWGKQDGSTKSAGATNTAAAQSGAADSGLGGGGGYSGNAGNKVGGAGGSAGSSSGGNGGPALFGNASGGGGGGASATAQGGDGGYMHAGGAAFTDGGAGGTDTSGLSADGNYNRIVVAGGGGGGAGMLMIGGMANDGHGGSGGAAKLTLSAGITVTADQLTINGGGGGGVDVRDIFIDHAVNNAGAGGHAEVDAAGAALKVDAISVTGGVGGERKQSVGVPNLDVFGAGGAGGNAVLQAGTVSAGSLTIMDGGPRPTDSGDSELNSGFGGLAQVGIGVVQARAGGTTITVADRINSDAPIENINGVTFKAAGLDLTEGDISLALDGTTAWRNTSWGAQGPAQMGVVIGDLTFAGGHGLTVTRTNSGTMTFGGNLSVAGSGNILNSPIAFDASGAGKTHTFNLSGVSAGSTMLTAQTSALNIGGAAVSVGGDQPALNLGQSLTLLANTAGTQATSAFTTSGAVQYGYTFSNPGGNSLALFHNSVATSGDWTAPSATYSATSAAGQPVSLTVGGTLYGVSALNLTDASNNLTVDIGTLDATAGNLTVNLTGTTAGNGVSGVRFNALNLGNGNTFQITGAGAYTGFNTYNVYGQAAYQGNLNAAGKNLNFFVPATAGNGATLLTVSGDANITGATTNVGIQGGSSPLQVGNQVVLIDATGTLTGALANTTSSGQGMQGVTLRYTFNLLTDSNRLLALVSSVGVNSQLKSLSEGRVAGHAFLNQGSDLIIGPGMYGILASTRGLTQGALVPFAAGSGGWSRYNTGSHVDVSGASMMTGLAWRQPLNDKGSNILAGAFFEAGWGGYDSYNSFSNAANVKGNGDISYYGGGVLGRYDFAPAGPGNIYLDASFRAGHVSTDFNSSDLRDSTGRRADYDSGSAYYGAHAGLGYVWNITEKASLDISTRYIWTHQDSDTVKVTGDPVKFNAVDSHRWRTGARFAYAINEYVAPYAGAYYDHEFDGKARASTNGYKIDAPDLKGGTGVGELGLTIKPVKDSGFSMDFGVQGYTGVREGVSGSLQLKLEF